MSRPASPRFRDATADDVAAVAELGRRTFSAAFAADNDPDDFAAYLDEAFSHEQIEREIADPGSTFVLAFADTDSARADQPDAEGPPIAYLKLRIAEPPPDSAHRARLPVELQRIYVTPEHMGEGIGGELLRIALDRAGRNRHDLIWLGVWEHNPGAQRLYRRHGFEVIGDQIFMMGDDPQRDLVMARELG